MKIKLGEAKDISTKVAPKESLGYQTDTPTKTGKLNLRTEPTNDLRLIETKQINKVSVDGWYGSGSAWFTREQIGEALEYNDPRIAIGKIHSRHKDRFEGRSTVTKLVTVDGKEREVRLYNFEGMLEICRWSRQPKANMVMDMLFQMAKEVMEKGYYSTLSDIDLLNILADKCIETGNTDKVLERFSKKSIKDVCYSKRYGATLKLLAEVKKYAWRDEFIAEYTRIWNGDTVGSNRYCRKVLKAVTQLPMKPYGWKQQ